MRKYETFFIVNPDLPDEVNAAVDDKVKNVVTANGGTVLTYTPWGKKKLAYPVKKHSRGLYVLMEYAGGPALVAELERNMRLDERVLKFITVVLDERFDPEKEAARLAAAEAAAAAAAAAPPSFEEDDDLDTRPPRGLRRPRSDRREESDEDEGDESDGDE